MLKKRITWLALGLIAALGVTVAAAPPLNLMPVYLWLGADKVSTANPLPVSGAGSSSSSPAYMTIVDSAGDSAVDATANAVRTTAYVTEGAATATAADIDQTGAKTIITVDVGAINASKMMCIFQNTDVAANTTLDEFNIYMAPAGYTATSMPVAYTEADFASPSGALLMVRTGAGGDTTDATPDTTLDESDYLIIWLDVSGMDSVTFQASAAADNAAVDAKCTYN